MTAVDINKRAAKVEAYKAALRRAQDSNTILRVREMKVVAAAEKMTDARDPAYIEPVTRAVRLLRNARAAHVKAHAQLSKARKGAFSHINLWRGWPP